MYRLKTETNLHTNWTACPDCLGRGKKRRKLSKKALAQFQVELNKYQKSNSQTEIPIRPLGSLYPCSNCSGSGLTPAENPPLADFKKYPHVAIIGGGIGGTALAVACLHRGIPFTLFERDTNFNARSQGYGLTLQQASKAIKGLGISFLEQGVISTKHSVHTSEGKVVGEWGMRKWVPLKEKANSKKSNIHIARQSLRLALLEQLNDSSSLQWNHQLVDYKYLANGTIELLFDANGKIVKTTTDLVVGADGIRSPVRRLILPEDRCPLRYLDCIVILGICSLKSLAYLEHPLLDSATVFQTANGSERIYVMPYDSESVMWQLSFPIAEQEAKNLSNLGPKYLKEKAKEKTQWHNPIPQLIAATLEEQVSGYPVYDRETLSIDSLAKAGQVTLLGDAAHPMSPFKGQGANQALLDALALAREITEGCQPTKDWRNEGIRKSVLNSFESEMIVRTTSKVKHSAEAAQFLHSESVLNEGNSPRGSLTNKN
jgi:2-polyprenyl-6-methoxyphenol hydroxylase-like FAD-dependent oxidoreductase